MVDIQAQAPELSAGAAPAGVAASPAARSLKNRLHWLWTWEQAQQRVQAQSTAGAGADRPTSAPAPREASASPSAAEPRRPVDTQPQHVEAGSVPSTGAARDARSVQFLTAPVLQKGAEPPGIPAASWFTSLEPGADRITGVKSSVDWSRWRVGNWEPQFMHIVPAPEGMRVWLRDFRLEPQGGFRLLAALRRELARSGIALAALTVNGHRVWEYRGTASAAADANGELTQGDLEGINYRY